MKRSLFKMFLEHKHKGHMQLEMKDQNHTNTNQCGQGIKACGCPDHQLNKEVIIKDIIVKRKYFCRICHKVSDCKPNLCEHAVNVSELGFYWPSTSW